MNWFRWGNCIASAFGIAWAYTSHKYDWLNIGGGESEFKEFWIAANEVVAYLTFCIWVSALVLVGIQDLGKSPAAKHRAFRIVATLLITPLVLSTAVWFLDIGIPGPRN